MAAVAFPCPIMALSKVQRLYDACDLVFSSPAQEAPSLGEIEWLRQLLGKQFVTHDGGPVPCSCSVSRVFVPGHLDSDC
jgi:hypothetical protein